MSVPMNDGTLFPTWDEAEKDLFSDEEIEISKLRTEVIGELAKAMREEGVSQAELSRRSDLHPFQVSCILRLKQDLRLITLIKMLSAVGKKLAVVDKDTV